MKKIIGIITLLMVMVAVFTGCDPNGGNKGNDGKAFEIPSYMKTRHQGEYDLIQPGDPSLGTSDLVVGHISITADDVTGYFTEPGKTPAFGTSESLKEWYELARKADPDSVKIGDSSTATIFTISNSIYQFQYIDLSTKEKNLQFIIRGTTGATPYKMQKTN